MDKQLKQMAESLSAGHAKRLLIIISVMHLDEYPLTDRDLAELLINAQEELQK